MHERNRGKGAAIRTAASGATGDYVIMCDADLEYSPAEIPSLLTPVLADDAQVVYGSRTLGSRARVLAYKRQDRQVSRNARG